MFVEEHLYCEECFHVEIAPRIEIKRRLIQSEKKTVEHLYLFDWVPGESDLLSNMVYQLKSGRCDRALCFYARLLAVEIKKNNFDAVVPLPGSTWQSTHSHVLAKEIARALELAYVDLFRKKGKVVAQKEKTLKQRQNTSIVVKSLEPLEHITTDGQIKSRLIYVDDILTTGNTFKLAQTALGNDCSACVLTVFYRPSLAQS